MDNIPRYGLKRDDLGKDSSLKSTPVASKNVAAKFLDTPGRRRMRSVIKVLGLAFFCLTVVILTVAFIGSFFKERLSEYIHGMFAFAFISMFFVNGLGMFIEIASDNSGRNWFAKGFFLSVVASLGGFLVSVFFALVF